MKNEIPARNRVKEQMIVVHIGYRKLLMPNSANNLALAAKLAEATVWDDTYTDDGIVYHRDPNQEIRVEISSITREEGPTLPQYNEQQKLKRDEEKAAAAAEAEQSDAEGATF